ncbi:sarcosine oxidase subunit gamma [Verminephrobacter aporrectodeae subsp. tuberculatae]|uniref:sarcosine oxidase subunit gamma n=1 Tax=Verminephrobacter aporrectodeae TaxID=1110389 RepID=UPI00224322F9|nr:sarcosine oxidase subunit gamma family protein [Verminephrobacter aporrectodeae]MCW8209233.1 sarcosine oxidase subunit gamma [Verminephrobacter aporrectodeae subsp. tuberculatae]
MPDPDLLRSPLHAFALPDRACVPAEHHRVRLCELPHLGYLVLRGRADDAAFMQAVAAVLGQPLPTQPMAVLLTARGVVLWVSPDEWLLVCQRSCRAALLADLGAALHAVFSQVVDNSGGLTTLRLAGPDHLLLLRQLGPCDFASLEVGHCVSTVFSKAGVSVVRTDAAGVLLLFRRSFADYVWRLIERTAQPCRPCVTRLAQCADPVFTPLVEGT